MRKGVSGESIYRVRLIRSPHTASDPVSSRTDKGRTDPLLGAEVRGGMASLSGLGGREAAMPALYL